MDDGVEAGVSFVGAQCDALELFEFTEEVLDQMPPFVHFGIDRQFAGSALMLGDDDLGAPFVEVGDDGVAVECLVGDQRVEADTIDERRHAERIEAVTGQQYEAHEIAKSVGQREDFGRHAALGAAYGLALSPPFAPWPWR